MLESHNDSTSKLGNDVGGFTPMEWSDEYVSSLWSFYSASESENYYASRFGAELLRRVEGFLPASGLVADYGCGSGKLSRLLAQHRGVLAVDFEKTLVQTRKMFEQEPSKFSVSFAEPEDVTAHEGEVSALFLLEAIEHLLPEWIEPTFNNFHTLLKPGGLIVCTTPNNEDVARATVCCPACKQYFHKYQHMRTFDVTSLAEFMEAQGFETLDVQAYNLGISTHVARLGQMLRKIRGKARYPHLVYIGKKRG